MFISRIYLLGLMLLFTQPVWAATAVVGEMASMLLHLEHYPSEAEKSRLSEIVASKDSSEQEKVVANAMINLKHTAAGADKVKLQQLKDDSSASAEARELAGIILNLNHKPSAADKSKLQQMMK